MIILAFDTGDMWGIAKYDDSLGEALQERVWCGMLPREQAEDWAANWIPHADLVITEQLVISMATVKKGRQVQRAIEGVGLVRGLCRWHGKPLHDKSKPADVMRFMTDARLKQLGLYVPGPDHPRDACRHLVTYLAENQHFDRSILLT